MTFPGRLSALAPTLPLGSVPGADAALATATTHASPRLSDACQNVTNQQQRPCVRGMPKLARLSTYLGRADHLHHPPEPPRRAPRRGEL